MTQASCDLCDCVSSSARTCATCAIIILPTVTIAVGSPGLEECSGDAIHPCSHAVYVLDGSDNLSNTRCSLGHIHRSESQCVHVWA
jgi:hypothetical protein